MSDNKVIAVVGATGAQGGGLVRAILNDPEGGFSVRAITRDANSDKARELAKMGAEVVTADVDDEESLKKVFTGVYGAFCVTFFWNHYSPERELVTAANMARAAKYADVKHVIWSTLEDTRKFIPLSDNRMPTLMGKYKVPHFDAKGEADNIFIGLGLPVTLLQTVFFWDNLIYAGRGPQKAADGVLEIVFPLEDKKLAGIAAKDIGKCAYAIFKRGDEFIGKTVAIAGEFLTAQQMADTLTEVLGQKIRYNKIPVDVFRGLGFPGAEDLGNMYQFDADFEKELISTRDLNKIRDLNPELLTFKEWAIANKNNFQLE